MEYQHGCGMFILADDNFIHCHAMFLPSDIIKWENLNPNINSPYNYLLTNISHLHKTCSSIQSGLTVLIIVVGSFDKNIKAL